MGSSRHREGENAMDWKRQLNHLQAEICQVLSTAGEAAEIFQNYDLFQDGSRSFQGAMEPDLTLQRDLEL